MNQYPPATLARTRTNSHELVPVPPAQRAHALTHYLTWLLATQFDAIADQIVHDLSPALQQMATAATHVAHTMTSTTAGAKLGRPRRADQRSSRGLTTVRPQKSKGS